MTARHGSIVQDEAYFIVFGMQNEAIKHGGVDIVLPLKKQYKSSFVL